MSQNYLNLRKPSRNNNFFKVIKMKNFFDKNFTKSASLTIGILLTFFNLFIVSKAAQNLLTTSLDDVKKNNVVKMLECLNFFFRDKENSDEEEEKMIVAYRQINVNVMAYFSLHLIASLMFINGLIFKSYRKMKPMICCIFIDIGLVSFLRIYLAKSLWHLINDYERKIELFYYLPEEFIYMTIMSLFALIVTDSYYDVKHSD